jgi:hypothetical protein
MSKTYQVEISASDWTILEWKHVDANQYIRDLVMSRVNVGIKELAEYEIQRRLLDPTWTGPIPADYRELLNGMEIKSARQMMLETAELQKEMMANPDVAYTKPAPSNMSMKP